MRRSLLARTLSALLLVLYSAGHPATLCAVDCLLGRHGAHQATHAGHHHEAPPAQPCHSGEVGAATTPPSAITAVAALPPSFDVGVVSASDSKWQVVAPAPVLRSISLPLDTPPPRG